LVKGENFLIGKMESLPSDLICIIATHLYAVDHQCPLRSLLRLAAVNKQMRTALFSPACSSFLWSGLNCLTLDVKLSTKGYWKLMGLGKSTLQTLGLNKTTLSNPERMQIVEKLDSVMELIMVCPVEHQLGYVSILRRFHSLEVLKRSATGGVKLKLSIRNTSSNFDELLLHWKGNHVGACMKQWAPVWMEHIYKKNGTWRMNTTQIFEGKENCERFMSECGLINVDDNNVQIVMIILHQIIYAFLNPFAAKDVEDEFGPALFSGLLQPRLQNAKIWQLSPAQEEAVHKFFNIKN
jgi:hypothetical protein